MADIQTLKRIYRRMAQSRASAPQGLAEQKAWLVETFLKRADQADGGGFQATSDSFEGTAFAGVYKGSSPEDLAVALDDAITEIEAEMAAIAASLEPTPAPASFCPRILGAPR